MRRSANDKFLRPELIWRMAVPSRSERLVMIFDRLGRAAPARTQAAALQQLSEIINGAEDASSGVSYDPEAWSVDGRIYPPMPDSRREVPGYAGIARYRTRKHNVYIAGNGAIEIQRLDDIVEFAKPGADGHGVWNR